MNFTLQINQWLTFKKALLIIFSVGFVVYFNSLFNGFVWDDEEQIVANAVIHSFTNIGHILSGATFQTGGAALSGWFFRPMITFTFMLNWAIWGGNAFGFHLFQVLFHLINSLLVYYLLLSLLKSYKSNLSTIISLLLAIIFAIHPAINEAVVYIAAVSEVMYTFGILLAWIVVIKSLNGKPSFKRLLTVNLLLFISMLFKESAVVGPVLIAAFLFIFRIANPLRWYLSFGITLISYFVVRLVVVGAPIQHPQFAPISEATIWERLLSIPSIILHYFTILIYPAKLAISQHFVIRSASLENFYAPLLVCLILFGLVSLFIYRNHSRIATFGLIWSTLTLGLILNIFPLDMTIAERWLYFPLIGLLIAGAEFLTILWRSYPKFATILVVGGFLTLLPMGIRGVIRNSNWSDGFTLYTHDSAINTESFDLQNNLGVELFRRGEINQAKIHFEKSLQLQPNWIYTINNLGAVYQNQGNPTEAEKLYLRVLNGSDYYRSWENLSTIYTLSNDPQKAKEFTSKGLSKLPNNPILWRNLAISEYKLTNQSEALNAAKNYYLLSPSKESVYIYKTIESKAELKLE